MATRGRQRRQERRQARRDAKKPQQQFYGGSKEESDQLRERNQAGIDAAGAQEERGLQQMDHERNLARGDLRSLSAQALGERERFGDQFAALDSRLAGERDAARSAYSDLDAKISGERATAGAQYDALGRQAARHEAATRAQGNQYGTSADRSMSDYASGRSAILGGASELENLGRTAAGRYTSAADAAFNVATERAQRQALSLAAGRGNDSIRTAMATAAEANQQAMLDQQVVRAQELNHLLGLEQNAITGAAGIRSGLAAQDQSAAQIQAARQEAARGDANNLLGMRGDLTGANAQLGLAAQGMRTDVANANVAAGQAFEGMRQGATEANANLGLATNAQRAGLATTNAELGMAAAGARQAAGAGARGQFLGAEGAMEGGQLGANMQYEAGRQQAAMNKGFTGFLSRVTGGLTNMKAVADAGDFGPGGKLLGKQQAVPY